MDFKNGTGKYAKNGNEAVEVNDNLSKFFCEISTDVILWFLAKSFAITPPTNPAPNTNPNR